MKFWSDTDGWIEADVLWDGKGRMPHETAEGWMQWCDPLFNVGEANGAFVTPKDVKGKANAPVRQPNARKQKCIACHTRFRCHKDGKCRRCHNHGVVNRSGPRPHCRGCGNRYHISELHSKQRMCAFCYPARGSARGAYQRKENAA